MLKTLIASLAGAALVLTAGIIGPARAADVPGGQLYLFIYHAGPAWKTGRPFSEQGLGPHGAYMKSLFEKKTVLAGGPFGTEAGGLAIVSAANPTEAKALLDADPAVVAGIFSAEVRPWTPIYAALEMKKP